MALSQKLAQFNKQQEKLHASLATITARPTLKPSSASYSRKAQPLSSQSHVPLVQRFSFTNDTEKLQQIASIRKSPVSAQIKRVLDLLLEVRSLNLIRNHIQCFPLFRLLVLAHPC